MFICSKSLISKRNINTFCLYYKYLIFVQAFPCFAFHYNLYDLLEDNLLTKQITLNKPERKRKQRKLP